MPSSDIRIVGWDLPASAGMTYELEFTSSEALTSLSVYVGGTLDDVDDLTDATEYAAVLSGGNLVATVELDVPSGTSAKVLRLVVNGAVITVGYLRPSAGGVKPSSPTNFSLAPSTYEFTLNVNGIVISGSGGTSDHGLLTGLTDDDHTQYALADGSRGSFASTGHDHDADYEASGAVAAHEADTTSVHGIADTSQLIVEGDSRLTDARTPTAHTHDDRYYTESEVDTALSGKSDTSHNHAGVYDSAGTASSAVTAHEADTTSVHGIADTSALLDTGDIGSSVQAHSAVLDATTASFTTADESKLDGIEAGATADQTGAEIKSAYEAEADTNAFTDAEKTKLAGVETGATADQTAADIRGLGFFDTSNDGTGSGLDADLLDGNEASAFATSAQGALADSATQPGDLAAVATSGDYDDLINKPDLDGTYAPLSQTINDQTGTTYTLVLTDAAKVVRCANASPVTLTVPPNSSVAFPTGTRIDITQSGAGALTVAQGSGVTINKPASLSLVLQEQWSQVTLVKVAADTWDIAGDLTSV